MSALPDVHLSDLLAAREDLAIIEKMSSASVRRNTQSAINKVIIGRVSVYSSHLNTQGMFKKRLNFAIKTLLFILQHFNHCPLQSSPL